MGGFDKKSLENENSGKYKRKTEENLGGDGEA